ncbi:hypothetical protein [Siminovitchia sp. 179-K 8D1 HS]|uniref:hypothetical protein n=1 Tax=Siminovitchia sp. 179-K 8D1 HS TaxID=3142385 RepID=UPI0039A07642
MCKDEEEKEMAIAEKEIPLKRILRKPKVKHNKFENMTNDVWKQTNEESKKNRGMSGITHKDLFGR